MESELVRPLRRSYGSEAFQYGDIYLAPDPRRRRPIVILHGGFWRPHRGLDMTAPVAEDLARRGWNTWNVEYRRNGQGEWPATLDDCDAAIDHLALLGVEFEFDRRRGTGHRTLGRRPPRRLVRRPRSRRVTAGSSSTGRSCRRRHLVGGRPGPRSAPLAPASARARWPSSSAAIPSSCRIATGRPIRCGGSRPASRVRCLHSRDDERVPFDQSVSYVDAARRCGDDAELIEVPGTHGDVIDIASAAWPIVVGVIESLEE